MSHLLIMLVCCAAGNGWCADVSFCDDFLPQFAVARQCLAKSGRCPSKEYQDCIDAERKEIAYWVGRDRDIRQEFVQKLEMARDAWWYLEQMQRNGTDWSFELRLNLGADAFALGVMPPFPGVTFSK